MPFATNNTTNVKGPVGDTGDAGLGYTDADLDGTHLVITDSKDVTHDVGEVVGAAGLDGADAVIRGSVATVADLADQVATAEEGDAYIVEADRHLYRFNGTEFIDVGGMAGPKGEPGLPGTNGIRGISWTVGNGAPVDEGQFIPGDKYLDVDTGEIYTYGGDGSSATVAYRLYPVDTTFWVLPPENDLPFGDKPTVSVRISPDSADAAKTATKYDLMSPAPVKAHEHMISGTLSNGVLHYVQVEDANGDISNLTVTPGDGGQTAPTEGTAHSEPGYGAVEIIEDTPFTGAEFYALEYTLGSDTFRQYRETLPMIIGGLQDGVTVTGIRLMAVNHAGQVEVYLDDATTNSAS